MEMKYIIDEALGRSEAESRIKPTSMVQSDEELVSVLEELTTVIRVIGCGGGGSNTIDRLAECGIQGAELFAINTDAQHLLHINADRRFLIGRRTTRGLGAGSLPAIGEEAAEEDIDEIKAAVDGADMVFVTCGLGGGTGTGASPVVAEAAREAGALTISIVTIPFSAEGSIRMQNAEAGLKRLREVSDTVIVVPNDRLLEISDRGISMIEAFATADQVLLAGVQGITDLITTPGLINLDFADVKSVMQGAGSALMGIGSARGEDRAVQAAELAISSPLLEASIDGAHGVLLSIQGGSDLGLVEITEAARLVQEAAHPEANIIFGTVIDDALGDEVRVTVIAAGFDGGVPQSRNDGRGLGQIAGQRQADVAAAVPTTVPTPPVTGAHTLPRPIPAEPDDVPTVLQPVAHAPASYQPVPQPEPAVVVSDARVPVEVPRIYEGVTSKEDLDVPDFLK